MGRMVKRLSTILLAAVLIFSLGIMAGCSKKETTSTTPTNTTATQPADTTPKGPTFSVGMTVAAKWKDNNYYLAEIKAVNNDKYDVAYADGDKGTVSADDMKEVPAKPTLKTGDKVLAVWTTAKFYSATVQEVKASSAVIKWDDGTAPSEVAFGKIIPMPAETTTQASNYKVGMKVAAKWKDNNYYLAEIKAVNNDKYDVAYADGDKGTVSADDIKEVPAKPTLKTGDKVLAVWTTAKFYSGTVKEVKANGAVIKWDDGTAPSEVAFGKIVKQ